MNQPRTTISSRCLALLTLYKSEEIGYYITKRTCNIRFVDVNLRITTLRRHRSNSKSLEEKLYCTEIRDYLKDIHFLEVEFAIREQRFTYIELKVVLLIIE